MSYYAKDITGRTIEYDCMSCDIASHKLVPPGGMIYEDDIVTLAGDVEVPLNGFIILAPKRHVTSLEELSREERYHMQDVLVEGIKALKILGICENVSIVQEQKHHLHVWLMPIYDWMKDDGCGVKNIRETFNIAKCNASKNGIFDVMYAIQRLKTYFSTLKF